MRQLHWIVTFVLALPVIHGGSIFAQWVQCSSLTSSAGMAFGAQDTILFAGTDGDGSYRSTDKGLTWTRMTGGLTNSTGFAFISFGPYMFLGNTGGVYRSADQGLTWASTGVNLTARSFLAVGGTILCTGDGGVYVSPDSGGQWIRTDTSGITVGYNFSLAATAGDILNGSNGAGVFRSTDGGMHWARSSTGMNNSIIYTLVADGLHVYAGTSGGLYHSTDGGLNWGLISGANITVRGLLLSGQRLFVATMYQGVLFTDDAGAHWTTANEGFSGTPTMNAFGISGDRLFVGTYGSGIWYRPISSFPVGVEENRLQVPISLRLLQNFPNPFNPSTTIRYGLPQRSQVELAVFNTLGQRVALLAQQMEESGFHEVQFDATGLTSGVYFYRIHAANTVLTRKLLVLR